jgi:fructokinase
MNPPWRIGVDLGGTKVEIAALDRDGMIRLRRRTATPRDDYPATVAAIAALVAAAERELGGRGTVGIGIPGTISALTGRVKNANATWLNHQPLREDLHAALGREVHGRPLAGANGIAGEWGHVPLPAPRDDERPGPRCCCGRAGCIETWLSGPALAADHLRTNGEPLDAGALAARAAAGEPAALASLERWLGRLARGLAMVIDVLDPDVVVLGGGLSNVESVYASLPARLQPLVFSDGLRTRIVRSAHGDSSGARGAAWLWGEAPSGRAPDTGGA